MITINLNNRGQLKMQEMAFVLLALALLGMLGMLFYVRLQSQNVQSAADVLNRERALSLRDRLAFLPEIKCAEQLCIDKDKVDIMRTSYSDELKPLFQGVARVEVRQIYPTEETTVIYDSGKAGNTTYSSFVNICQQKQIGTLFSYDCGLGMLKVSA